ncbi:recombinase family protein [Streptomyces ovatisporus]|uniref:Recombinase family protein n=1 Tax=Streptomyces ovatisporus TaxID=1128682 RepID=A0ABV9AH34_9ACTN
MDDTYLLVEAHDCPMSTCAVPAGSPCRTGQGKVAAQYHTARFRLVPQTREELNVPTPSVRRPGATWTELPRPASAATTEPTGHHVRIGYARASTARQSLDSQVDALTQDGVQKIFQEKISTRVKVRPELEKAITLACELRASGVRVTLAVHEHKRLGRGADLVNLAERLRSCDVGLEFLTGELKGSHDPGGVVFSVLAAMSGMEREYIREKTLDGQESARKRGKTIGGAKVSNDDMLSMALHLREQDVSLRDIASRLVITTGKKKGKHPSAATVMRMLREYDEAQAQAASAEEATPSSSEPRAPEKPTAAATETEESAEQDEPITKAQARKIAARFDNTNPQPVEYEGRTVGYVVDAGYGSHNFITADGQFRHVSYRNRGAVTMALKRIAKDSEQGK